MQRKKNKLIQENILHSTFRHYFLKHTLQIFFHRSCEIKYFSTGFEENPCPFIYWLKLNAISHTWSTSTSWYLLKRVKIPQSLINSLGCQKNERGQNCPGRGTDRQMYRHCVDMCCTPRHGAPCLLCVSGISNSKANLACMKKERLKNTRLCQLNVKIYVPKEWVLSALQTERFTRSLTGINGLQRRTGGSKDSDSTVWMVHNEKSPLAVGLSAKELPPWDPEIRVRGFWCAVWLPPVPFGYCDFYDEHLVPLH